MFRPFDSPALAAAPVAAGAPDLLSAPSVGAAALRGPPLTPPGLHPPSHGTFEVAPDDMPEDDSPDAVPRDLDPAFASGVSESLRSEFCRMLSFIVDLFSQAAGSPSVAPPPRALFGDFFSPSALPQQPIFNWFERVHAALAAAGRSGYSFISSPSQTYAVHCEFAQGKAFPLNPS